jgi:23S rRNA pseudouridine1911/1915/1917 synthase
MPKDGDTHWSGEVARDIPPATRLDRYAAEYLKLLSRSQIKARGLHARVNGRPVKISRILKGGDRLELSWTAAPPVDLIPQNLPLDIIYEDDRVAVLNKAQGMVVHPGAGNHSGTLANALLWRRLTRPGVAVPPAGPPVADTRGIAAVPLTALRAGPPGVDIRPGIVHRLDKDTSGVIITAWDEEAHEFLARQFRDREARKTYAALVKGAPPARRGRIDTLLVRDKADRTRFIAAPPGTAPVRGKRALTFYTLLRAWEGYSLLLLRPKTGRTHQIRVHLRHLGCPILGDPLYGSPDRRFPGATLMLHALRLTIALPREPSAPGTPEKPRTFTAPLPERFRILFRALGAPTVHG